MRGTYLYIWNQWLAMSSEISERKKMKCRLCVNKHKGEL